MIGSPPAKDTGMTDLITQALTEAPDTMVVVLRHGAVDVVGDVFKELFGEHRAVVVGDERTMEVAGNRVQDALTTAGVPALEPYVFPGEPELYAEYANIEQLRDHIEGTDAIPVAVGAGTLNDIVKRAASELDRSFLVVPTAASMDGYTAFGSSIAVVGIKQTLSCPAPRGCVADLDILAAAPQRMTASGYGDLLGKVPAGADWILADALGVEPIDRPVWDKVQGPLRQALSRPEALSQGHPDAVADLAEGLVMSGLAMQAHQSSRPASGAEHQFSHLWEMEGHGVNLPPPRLSHGFKVGVGTVAIAALYEVLLSMDIGNLDVDAAVAAWSSQEDAAARVRELNAGSPVLDESVAQTLAKWVPAEQVRTRLTTLVDNWDGLVPLLREQLLPAEELQRRLRAVGAPAHPADIDLDWQQFRDTYQRGQTIRKRYTVLDVALEAGVLETIVDRLFASGGFWGRQEG